MSVAKLVRRRFAVVVAVIAVLMAVAYTLYWFHVAGVVGKGIAAWSDARRAEGWQVGWERLAVGGYPLRVIARLDRPRLTSPSGLSWQAESASASASPFDLGHVVVSAPGRHRVGLGAAEAAITVAELRADLAFDTSGRLRQLRGTARTLAVEGTGAGAESVTLAGTRLDPAAPLTERSPVLSFSAAAAGVELPALPGLALGRRIAAADLSGRVLGPIPATASARDALDAWSAGGGTIAIDRLALDWEPMSLEADGTLAFDPAMQPLAAFSARVRGTAELMDRLAATGVMAPGAAEAAKLMLSLMAKPDPQGRPAIPVPVTLQDGALWLGPARIAHVPPIPWPERTR